MHNSCLSIWSIFSWPLNRLSDDFFLKAKALEVFQPGAYRSIGRFKARGLGKLHLKLLISYGICKEHENIMINSFYSWIYIYIYIFFLFFTSRMLRNGALQKKYWYLCSKKSCNPWVLHFQCREIKPTHTKGKKNVRQSLLTYRKRKTG